MTTRIDLKATFGRQYRVALEGFDAGYSTQHGRREVRDALLGHVFPHGGDLLAAWRDRLVPSGAVRGRGGIATPEAPAGGGAASRPG